MKGYQIALIAVIVIILIVGGGIGIYYATKEETVPQFVTDAQNRLEDEESAQIAAENASAGSPTASVTTNAATNASKPATTTSNPTSFSGTASSPTTNAATNASKPATTTSNPTSFSGTASSPAVIYTTIPATNPTPAKGTAGEAAVITDAEVVAIAEAHRALEQETAAKEAAKLAEIDVALAEVYGLYSDELCPVSSCMFGSIKTTDERCSALGGTLIGPSPDPELSSCQVKIGKNAQLALFPAKKCTSGECQYGYIQTTGATCDAISGIKRGAPGAEWMPCRMDIGPVSLAGTKYGLFPSGKCPFGTCYPVRIGAKGASCRKFGGSSTASDTKWGECEMNLGRTARV